MAKKAAYVVWRGHVPGVYLTWTEAEKQVRGFPYADHRGFPTVTEAEAAWNGGRKLKGGGFPYVHGAGIPCGHGHKDTTRRADKVTCPACLRALAAGFNMEQAPPLNPPKPKKEKVPVVFRLWNLKTATWASENRHERSDDCLRERIARLAAASPAAQGIARASLLMMREDDTAYRDRRQSIFDQRYPKIAARRVAQQHEQHGQSTNP